MDVGSGNGQAAVGLGGHFDRVIGVEPSAEQVRYATAHPSVEYRVGTAEATGLGPRSTDLMLAAQAFHWFDREPFFAEVARVLRPGGVLALACYSWSRITPEVDAIVDELYRRLDPYWEPERRLVEAGYATVRVPFPEIGVPPFEMRSHWSVEDLIGYVGTWSALRKATVDEGRNPLEDVAPQLAAAWGAVERREARWPLAVRAFRLPSVH